MFALFYLCNVFLSNINEKIIKNMLMLLQHGLMSPWQIGAELPMDSDEADDENKMDDGKTLLYVFERGYC